MTKHPVVLVTGPNSLPGFEARVRSLHRPCRRIQPIRFEAVARERLLAQLARFGDPVTTIVVTSREAVENLLVPLRERYHATEIVASGPRTAAHARSIGFLRVRECWPAGAEGVVRVLSGGPVRRIVYARSDRAGPSLSRRLRAKGHGVLDLVAYRTVAASDTSGMAGQFSKPFVAVITSPSAMSELRRAMGQAEFARFRQNARPVALGAKTARAVRGHGLRNVRTAALPDGRDATPQHFEVPLLRVLSDDA
jgi:uroporphyrinogen-III synthase